MSVLRSMKRDRARAAGIKVGRRGFKIGSNVQLVVVEKGCGNCGNISQQNDSGQTPTICQTCDNKRSNWIPIPEPEEKPNEQQP